MAIYFKAPPEPLAGPPGEEVAPSVPILAETQASKRLLAIVERYCNREIAGRSVLIAGHRGAGKTTLVKAAIQNLRGRPYLRGSVIPLYVQIHGPDLLGGETVLGKRRADDTAPASSPTDGGKTENSARSTPAPAKASNSANGNQRTKEKDQDEIDQALTSLRVLTIALHRAFITDLGWAFERGVCPQQLPAAKRSHARRSDDLQELAAQLRLDFDDLVETDSLRWMWNRAGFLHQGILREGDPTEDVARRYFSKQGLLEIVAATCVSDSFVRCVAKVDDTDKTKAEAEFRQSQEIEKITERKELANAVAGIIAGGIAGTGVALNGAHTTANGALSGLVFVLSAAITTTLLNYTSIRTRSKKRTRERNIQWDRSVASLDLMLPLAIARVLDAGRAPIFVIDELDKVNDIRDKLEGLINRLKHIVADRALFCFLVDRSYFERIQAISRMEPHRKEHTFFSERLYAIATPAQWRSYLQTVLTSEAPGGPDRLQLLALTYLLMARSKMHAIDIRREIDALPHDLISNRLDLPDLLGPALYRNMIYMQAVVEYVLEDDKLKSRLQRDPNFAQSMYDALYYLLRQWEQDKAPALTRTQVKSYLESRMSDSKDRSKPLTAVKDMLDEDPLNNARPNDPIRSGQEDRPPELSEVDFGSLYSAIEQMANLLSDPNLFKNNVREKIAQRSLPSEWADVVEILPDKPLLQPVGEEWHWLFDINANPVQVPETSPKTESQTTAMQPAPPEPGQLAYAEAQIKDVERIDAAVRFFTEDRLSLENLGNELRLVPISPTYNSFLTCASNYRANAGAGPMELTYPSLSSDKAQIQEYSANVGNALRGIKRTIFLAEFLAYEKNRRQNPLIPPTSRTRTEMMRLVAADLDFHSLTSAQIDSQLAEFKSEFEPAEQALSEQFEKIEQDTSPLDPAWVKLLQDRLREVSQQTPSILAVNQMEWPDIYFSSRAKALVLHARNKQKLKRFSLKELRVVAFFDMPAFHGDPDNIRLLDYADALAATTRFPTSSGLTFALALLAKLGFGKQVETLAFEFAPLLGEELTADLTEAARSGQRTRERVILILGGSPEERVPVGDKTLVRTKKGEGSYAADWKTSKTHAVYPVHVSDIANLRLAYPNVNNPLIYQLAISIELQDEGVQVSFLGAQVLQGSFGSLGVGRPQSLDDAIAIVTRNYPSSLSKE